METRDAVALAHAWACAAPGDDAERVGDALSSRCSAASTPRPRATSAPVRRSGCARSTRRRTTTTATAAARRSSRSVALGGAAARAALGALGAALGEALARPLPDALEDAAAAALLCAARRDASPARRARRGAAARGARDGSWRRRASPRGDWRRSSRRWTASSATPRRPRPRRRVAGSSAAASFWRRDWERNARVVAAAGSAATLRASTTAPARGARRAPPAASGASARRSRRPPARRARRSRPCATRTRAVTPATAPSTCSDGRRRSPRAPTTSARRARASARASEAAPPSVVVLGADARFRCAAEARRAVQRVLRVGCSVNLYATPRAQALDAHYDDHCVFVVQLRGRKRRLYGPALECPTLHEATLPPPPELLRRGADNAVTLSPGDVLYVPRGVYHAATACEDAGSDSAHVTVGVDLDPALTWRGAFHAAARGRRDAARACAAPPKRRRRCGARACPRSWTPRRARRPRPSNPPPPRLGPAARGRRGPRSRTTSRPSRARRAPGAIAVGAADFADAARAVEARSSTPPYSRRGAVARRPRRVRGAVRVLPRARRRGVT
ncbi:histone demethylase [Aureococcus anophagefferens]|nr:histone demethylase [Aureococcus anophagefferens]